MEKRAYTWQQPGQPWQLSPALVILLRSFVWAEHVGSLKQTRRLEDQPQVNEQKDWAKRVLSANPEPWLLLPRHSLPLLHSDPSLHTPLTACVFPSSGSRHSRNAKERSQLNVFHSLLLHISVSNNKTDNARRAPAGRQEIPSKTTDLLTPQNYTFLRTGKEDNEQLYSAEKQSLGSKICKNLTFGVLRCQQILPCPQTSFILCGQYMGFECI